MEHCHLAGGGLTAVLCGDGDGGLACAHGVDGAVLHGGDIGIVALPSHIFVGGVVRLHRGGEGRAAAGE